MVLSHFHGSHEVDDFPEDVAEDGGPRKGKTLKRMLISSNDAFNALTLWLEEVTVDGKTI